MAFVFGRIAALMCLGQHAPDFRRQAGGMRQRLEHQITVVGTIAHAAQRIQREGMGGVVSQIETAVELELAVDGVIQSRLRRRKQALLRSSRR